jgi:hypothetical protein
MAKTPGGSPVFRQLGEALHGLLHGGEIGTQLAKARAASPVRLLLDITPALRALPWELMRSGVSKTFTDISHPTARLAPYYESNLEQVSVWPLKVMVVVGSTDDSVNARAEIAHIHDAFRGLCGFVDLEVLWLPTRAEIVDSAKHKPHVFHFIGHGSFDEEMGGYLLIDQPKGTPKIQWTASGMYDDLSHGPPRLAILNACHSGESKEAEGTWAVAEGLAGLRVPAIVAMCGPIKDQAAERFAASFYQALSEGKALDVAVAYARSGITQVVPENRREYALPALILGAEPERILDLSVTPLEEKIPGPVGNSRIFVDRVPKRRQLWERLCDDQNAPPRIVIVTGPARAGKGEFVRWCLGVASVWDHPVAAVDLSQLPGSSIDSVQFLQEIVEELPASIVTAVPNGLAMFRAELAEYDSQRKRARAGDGDPPSGPAHLYQRLCELLSGATLDRSLILGIDGLNKLLSGEWESFTLPDLIKPLAGGAAGRVRLIVALEESEREQRFRRGDFNPGDVLDISLAHFKRDQYVDLMTQYLRARGFVRSAFEEKLKQKAESIPAAWTTLSFESLYCMAREEGWETED